MTLSTEELQRVENGEFVPVVVDGTTVYVISTVTAAQVKSLLEDAEALLPAVAEAWAADESREDSQVYEW